MLHHPSTEQSPSLNAAALQVYLLGPPTVEWASRSLTIPRRQVRAQLYRLAAGQRPVPREHLCGLFWPDIPESIARRNLTGLLSHLRRDLPRPEVLVTLDDRVWLNPDRIWSDTAAFRQLCADQKLHPSSEALRQAVDLYRGPFLNGFSLPDCPEFELWLTLERQTWERLYLETLADVVEERTASGDYAAAITYARRYLATDDLAEDIHRRLIELYAATGDRGAALRQFEHCVTVLERELGVSPLPETRAAYQAVLSNRPPLKVASTVKLAWTTLPSLDVALVGRDEALRRLELAYARARSGHGGMVLISGEPGIGKSRLMQDFATRLQDQALVLAGAGHLDTQAMPYQPVVEALRSASSAHYASLDVPRCCLAETSRLMPELRTLHPGLPPPLPAGSGQARTRLFEALCRLTLALAAGRQPVLLCLDDLHWADETTLDWLAYLGRRLRGSRLLVIGTYRSGEANVLAELCHSLTRQDNLSELKLGGLDETAILQLLRHLDGSVAGEEALGGRLCQVTGGNPFFLLEILRAIIESGQRLEAVENLEDLVPDTVLEAVEARMKRLSPKARQVLEAGAVLGQTFVFDLMQPTSGRLEVEIMDGLDELVARQLLVEQTAGYRFRHEIIRAAVYHNLSYWRQRLLHRRAGEALERLQPDNVTALAWHFERAKEPGRAAQYALRAGQAAKAIFAHAEAQACFDRALALLEQEAADLREPGAVAVNQRLRIQVFYERGWALRLLGDMDAYAHDLHQVSRLARSLGDPRTLAHLRWREAYTHRWFCRYAEAQKAATEGVQLSQAADDRRLEAMCQREVGLAARATGDYHQARVGLERASSLFVELGDVVYEIHVLGNLATLCWYMGEYDKALSLSRQALSRCEETGLLFHRRVALGDMGAAAAALGDADLARRCLGESLSIARQAADRTQEILCLNHLGWLCVRLEQPAEAIEYLQAGLALAESIGSCTEQSWLLSGLAEAHRLSNDVDLAVVHARRALELAQASGAAYDQKLAHRILSKLRKADLQV